MLHLQTGLIRQFLPNWTRIVDLNAKLAQLMNSELKWTSQWWSDAFNCLRSSDHLNICALNGRIRTTTVFQVVKLSSVPGSIGEHRLLLDETTE